MDPSHTLTHGVKTHSVSKSGTVGTHPRQFLFVINEEVLVIPSEISLVMLSTSLVTLPQNVTPLSNRGKTHVVILHL